jgi:hypothetical protein
VCHPYDEERDVKTNAIEAFMRRTKAGSARLFARALDSGSFESRSFGWDRSRSN